MPGFGHPWFLTLLLLVPPLAWWWSRRRRRALRYPAQILLAGLPAGRSRAALWSEWLGQGLGLALLIVALAGPRWPDLHSRAPAEGIAIEMVVDVSGSMEEPDFIWLGQPISRLEAVKKVFERFIQGEETSGDGKLRGRAGDLIGLIAFATHPESRCPLTLSHAVLLQMLRAEKPRTGEEAHTNISDALVMAQTRLQEAGPRRRVIILLSDGEHNVPTPASQLTPREAAQLAGNLDMTIHTIDAGGTGQAGREPDVKETSAEIRAAGVRTLQEIAHIAHGRYFQAHDTETLVDVCRSIDRLERDELESYQYRRYFEAYPWCGLAAFVLLGGGPVLLRFLDWLTGS
jgi:Ca-activated chloride channel family protein